MKESKVMMAEVGKVEQILKASLHRIDLIEKKLSTQLLSFEGREKLETELEEVKELLKSNEEKLKKLRVENSKSFVVIACLIFLIFLVFGLYTMFFRES